MRTGTYWGGSISVFFAAEVESPVRVGGRLRSRLEGCFDNVEEDAEREWPKRGAGGTDLESVEDVEDASWAATALELAARDD